MKTKLFFLIAVLLAFAGLERGNAQELPDTVWTKQLELSQKVHVLKFSPDGQYFYAGINNYIAKYETMTGNHTGIIYQHGENQIQNIDFSPSVDTLLSSVYGGALKLWDINTGELLFTSPVIDEYDNKLQDAFFFDNGNKIICSIVKLPQDTTSPNFVIFDVNLGNKVNEFGDKQNSSGLKVSKSEKYFSFFEWAYSEPFTPKPPRGNLYLYDLNTLNEINLLESLELEGHGDMEFTYDNQYLASSGSGKVKIWNVETRELVKELNASEIVRDIEFSKDNKYLLIGTGYTSYSSIWIYDVENDFEKIYEYLYPLSSGGVLDITPDSKYLISKGHFNVKGDYHSYLQLLNKKWTEVGIEENEKPYEIIYPNPTNNIVNIDFSLTISSQIDIDLYNAVGQFIQKIYTGYLEQGEQTIPFDASTLPAGLYFIRLNSPASTITYKLVKEG